MSTRSNPLDPYCQAMEEHILQNIDRQIILEVIKERYYQFVQAFSQQALQALRTIKRPE